MTLRLATAADIPALRKVAIQAATAAHWGPETYASIFSRSGPSRLVLLAEESGEPVGFVVVLAAGSEWEIENVAVVESARRRGLGTRLLREVLRRAQAAGTECLFLEVRESNRGARKFYEKLFFVESGRRRGYYSDPPEDAILYQLPLAGQ